jgi:hypothetical protein
MFEQLFSPANAAEKWKGRVKLIGIYIPAIAFWAAVFSQLVLVLSGNARGAENFIFVVFVFGGVCELVGIWIFIKAKMIQQGGRPVAGPINRDADFVPYLESGQLHPKIPFTYFAETSDGTHKKVTERFDKEEDVIDLLNETEMSVNEIKLRMKEYERFPNILRHLEYLRYEAEMRERDKIKEKEGSRLDELKIGETVNFLLEE